MKIRLLLVWQMVLIILVPILSSCSNGIDFPSATGKPQIVVFCSQDANSCFELRSIISPSIIESFGEDQIEVSYIFVDSENGKRIFDSMSLSEVPSYVLFDANAEETLRTSELDLDLFQENLAISMTKRTQ